MAKIQLYSPSQRLTTESPTARRSPQAEGQFGRDLQVAGNAMTEAHDVIRKAYDWQQMGSAKLKTLEGTETIEQKALADGENTTDLSAYESDLARLKADTVKGITNPAVKAKFEMDFDLQAAQTRTKIKTIMWNRVKEKGIADTSTINERLSQEYAISGDDNYLLAIQKNIDSLAKAGFIGADDAQKLKTKATESAHWNKYLTDYKNNPTETVKNTDKYGLTIEQIDKARRMEKEVDRIVNENRAVNFSTMTDTFLDGLGNESDIENAVKVDKANPGTGITEKQAISLKKAWIRGVTGSITDLSKISANAKTYMQAIDLVFSDKPKQRLESYQKILDIYSDGYTDKDETKFLNKLSDTAKDISKNTDTNPMKAFWRGIQNKFTNTTDEKIKSKIAMQVQSVLADVQKGKTIEQGTQRLSKEEIAQYFPDYATYDPKNGKLKVDGMGNKIRIFPDGTSKEE